MIRFKSYIIEATAGYTGEEKKLKHLTHNEDHVILGGKPGLMHAINNISGVHSRLRKAVNGEDKKGDHNTKITTKYDGAPSIVFGRHPENGKFFVASKSAFNKEPKINYTPEDIERNHGHAPGLVEKLKHALKHLPKVTPPAGVFQGDIMHTKGDVKHHGYKVSFKPNTITYSAKTSSPHGKAAAESKIGVAVHTAYKGDTLDNMQAEYAPNLSHFKPHKDVHLISTEQDLSKAKYDEEKQQKVKEHLKKAVQAARRIPDEGHDAIGAHAVPLTTYINHTVRTGDRPSYAGFMDHYTAAHKRNVDKVKTEKAKEGKRAEMSRALGHVMDNKDHFENLLRAHHHLQKAKDIQTHAMSSATDFDHHIDGKKAKPEGFVVVRDNKPTKFVDRAEFSRANFGSGKPGSQPNG